MNSDLCFTLQKGKNTQTIDMFARKTAIKILISTTINIRVGSGGGFIISHPQMLWKNE